MTITRRTVLKSIAAAIMCPTIQLRQTIPDERLLAAFCYPEECRYDFQTPFGLDSLTYATDARALIRAELPSRIENGERHLPKGVINIWKAHFNPQHQWRALTPDDLRPTSKVEENATYDLCPECGGNATVFLGDTYPESIEEESGLLRYGYDIDTNSIRDKSCPMCHGLDYVGPSVATVCGVRHSSFALKRVLALPNVRVCQSLSVPEALLFRADGFEGISLGMIR